MNTSQLFYIPFKKMKYSEYIKISDYKDPTSLQSVLRLIKFFCNHFINLTNFNIRKESKRQLR